MRLFLHRFPAVGALLLFALLAGPGSLRMCTTRRVR